MSELSIWRVAVLALALAPLVYYLVAIFAALRFFLTRLNDWTATPAGALVRPKDPLEYERKLAVHRAGVALFEAMP